MVLPGLCAFNTPCHPRRTLRARLQSEGRGPRVPRISVSHSLGSLPLATLLRRSAGNDRKWYSYAPRRILQPRPRLVIDQRRESRAHTRVIGVEPGAFLVGQYLRLDEAEIDRRQRDGLELHHLAF